MTVGELIEDLRKCDPDKDVLWMDDEYAVCEHIVIVVNVPKDADRGSEQYCPYEKEAHVCLRRR